MVKVHDRPASQMGKGSDHRINGYGMASLSKLLPPLLSETMSDRSGLNVLFGNYVTLR